MLAWFAGHIVCDYSVVSLSFVVWVLACPSFVAGSFVGMTSSPRAQMGTIYASVASIFEYTVPLANLVDAEVRSRIGCEEPSDEQVQEFVQDQEKMSSAYESVVKSNPVLAAELLEACSLFAGSQVVVKSPRQEG